jgi:hypothetical protein
MAEGYRSAQDLILSPIPREKMAETEGFEPLVCLEAKLLVCADFVED